MKPLNPPRLGKRKAPPPRLIVTLQPSLVHMPGGIAGCINRATEITRGLAPIAPLPRCALRLWGCVVRIGHVVSFLCFSRLIATYEGRIALLKARIAKAGRPFAARHRRNFDCLFLPLRKKSIEITTSRLL